MDITNNALFGTVVGGIILAILTAVYKKFTKNNDLDNTLPKNIEAINDREEVNQKVKKINLSKKEKDLYQRLATLYFFAEKKVTHFSQIYSQPSYKDEFYKFRDDISTICQYLREICKSSPDVSQDFSESFLTVLGAIFNTEKLAPNGSSEKDYEISLYYSNIKNAFLIFETKFKKK